MAYTSYADKLTAVSRTTITASAHNDEADGIQAEFEDRMEAHLLNGVVTGMAPSISTTNIAIASGEAYVEGKRYAGSGTVSFSAGDSADDYYIYVDPTDDTTPYKKATADPGSGYLVLALVTWNGSDTLSALVDLRAFGLLPWEVRVGVDGTVSAGTIAMIPLPRGVFIEGVVITLGDSGTVSGATTVDVHLGDSASSSVTIFTTQGRRPSIAYTDTDHTVAYSGTPDGDRTAAAGQYLEVIVDAVPGGADSADLGVTIYGRWM